MDKVTERRSQHEIDPTRTDRIRRADVAARLVQATGQHNVTDQWILKTFDKMLKRVNEFVDTGE